MSADSLTMCSQKAYTAISKHPVVFSSHFQLQPTTVKWQVTRNIVMHRCMWTGNFCFVPASFSKQNQTSLANRITS